MKKIISVLCAIGIISACLSGCALTLSTDDNKPQDTPSTASAVESGNDVNVESLNGVSSAATTESSGEKLLYVTGTSEKIAMRETDEDTGTVVGQLSMGDEVSLLSADSVMYYCVYHAPSGKQGYVKKAFLTDEKSAVCKGEECFASKQTPLYDTKESDHKELQKLNAGTSVTVLAKTSGDYWFVNQTGTKTYGYMKCMDITSTKPAASSSKAASSAKTTSSAKPAANTAPANTGYYTGPAVAPIDYTLYYAKVNTGYLAIRSAKSFDASNEIGKMYTGDSVYVIDTSTGTYWYCYSPSCGVYGYVNSDYLVSYYPSSNTPTASYSVWTVRVNTGYLALRSAKSFDASNEIGKLYSGNTVYVYSDSYVNFSDTYWYVYAPSLGQWGYVNSNYIYS